MAPLRPIRAYYCAVHPLLIRHSSLHLPANSDQATLRHPKVTIYRCYLPVLTGFIGSCRAGPDPQRRLTNAVPQCRTSKGNSTPLRRVAGTGHRQFPV